MILYDLLYLVGLLGYLPYGLVTGKVHRGWWQRLGVLPADRLARLREHTVLWVHAVSVGEVRAAGTLIRALEDARPDVRVVLTTTTETGWGVARTVATHPEFVFYSPLDLGAVVQRFLRALRPRGLVLMESELWPNLLAGAAGAGVPVVVANGRVSPRSFRRYQRASRLVRRWFRWVALFLMQSPEDARRLVAVGAPPERVRIVGNLKFDQLPAVARPEHLAVVRRALQVTDGTPVWVCGSTHPGEEELLLAAFQRLRGAHPALRLVLAPRHPERAAVLERLVTHTGYRVRRASQTEEAGGAEAPEVVLLDMMGQLPMVYQIATVVFMGGSLVPHGGHNPIEPAQHGKPVVFGPHMFNFADIAAGFVSRGAARQVPGAEPLADVVSELLADPAARERMGAVALQVIREHEGATRRSIEQILACLAD